MAGLDDLRKRVEAAEQHFGLIATQSRKYSERLTALVSQMEQTHGEQQCEIAALNGRLGQFEQENRQLKSMLMGLLQAIESGGDRGIDHAVRDLEGRIGRMIGSAEAAPIEEAGVDADVDADLGFDLAPVPVEAEADGAEDAILDEGTGDEDVADWGEPAAEETESMLPPVPETVALDDGPAEGDSLSDSATELLDRVEAAASALLAAGVDDEGDDEDDGGISQEIEALLASAIHGEPAVGAPAAGGTADEDAVAEDDEMLMFLGDDEVAEKDAA